MERVSIKILDCLADRTDKLLESDTLDRNRIRITAVLRQDIASVYAEANRLDEKLDYLVQRLRYLEHIPGDERVDWLDDNPAERTPRRE